jgi:glyoxalase family protein
VTLSEREHQRTASLLADTLGFRRTKVSGNRIRYETGEGGPGAIVDVEAVPGLALGRVAVGTVHHVAWRTPTDAEQAEWRAELVDREIEVTPIIDRKYFHSIYFREPGGVLFEIATDPPGFAVDESLEALGERLVLPVWLEPRRADLEMHLPPVRVPRLARGA